MFDVHEKSIIIVKHSYFESSGTPEAELLRFLRGKASSILYIRHPFPDAKQIPLNTVIGEFDADGTLHHETIAPLVHGVTVLFYIKDVVFTVYYVLKTGRTYDLFIGADNLNTLAGLILRLLGKVRKVVYYVIDFTPIRFKNKVLNKIYQTINKFCCYHSNIIWNVSEAMIEGRENIGIKKGKSAPQITVPLGCPFREIPRKSTEEINLYTIVYFGMLREEHGPGLILEALPFILKKEPRIRVIIAGDGELKPSLMKRADELSISPYIHFTGFIGSGEEVYNILTTCGLALATYPPGTTTYKTYSDPGKVKLYLACGLPVIITDVPLIAKEIARRGAGIIVSYDPENLALTVIEILQDNDRYKKMREQAAALAEEYDWAVIWDRTFTAIDF